MKSESIVEDSYFLIFYGHNSVAKFRWLFVQYLSLVFFLIYLRSYKGSLHSTLVEFLFLIILDPKGSPLNCCSDASMSTHILLGVLQTTDCRAAACACHFASATARWSPIRR